VRMDVKVRQSFEILGVPVVMRGAVEVEVVPELVLLAVAFRESETPGYLVAGTAEAVDAELGKKVNYLAHLERNPRLGVPRAHFLDHLHTGGHSQV